MGSQVFTYTDQLGSHSVSHTQTTRCIFSLLDKKDGSVRYEKAMVGQQDSYIIYIQEKVCESKNGVAIHVFNLHACRDHVPNGIRYADQPHTKSHGVQYLTQGKVIVRLRVSTYAIVHNQSRYPY